MRPLVASKGGSRIYNPLPIPRDPEEREHYDTFDIREDEMRIQRSYPLHAVRLRVAYAKAHPIPEDC